jgi:hypothetical protein
VCSTFLKIIIIARSRKIHIFKVSNKTRQKKKRERRSKEGSTVAVPAARKLNKFPLPHIIKDTLPASQKHEYGTAAQNNRGHNKEAYLHGDTSTSMLQHFEQSQT